MPAKEQRFFWSELAALAAAVLYFLYIFTRNDFATKKDFYSKLNVSYFVNLLLRYAK